MVGNSVGNAQNYPHNDPWPENQRNDSAEDDSHLVVQRAQWTVEQHFDRPPQHFQSTEALELL